MKLVGLLGTKGSGKSTVAAYAVRMGYTVVSFAGPLKAIISDAIPFLPAAFLTDQSFKERSLLQPIKVDGYLMRRLLTSAHRLYGLSEEDRRRGARLARLLDQEPLYAKTPRRLLQIVGSDLFRDGIRNDFWIQLGIQRAMSSKGPVVFDDVRFANEVQAIQSVGGKVVRIKRGPDMAPEHQSENIAALPYDYLIDNNSTLSSLENSTLAIFTYMESGLPI